MEVIPKGINIANLSAGTYQIKLKDSQDCESVDAYAVTVAEPDALTIEAKETNVKIKAFEGTGNAQIKVSGGNVGKQILYNVEKSETQANALTDNYTSIPLYANTYTFRATDGKQCQSNEVNVVLSQPESKLTFEATVEDALCASSTGSMTIVPSGGWAPYKVEILDHRLKNGVEASAKVKEGNLYAGKYTVRVTDSEGEVYQNDVEIQSPPALKVDCSVTADKGDGNGTAVLTVSGGTPSYSPKFIPRKMTPETNESSFKYKGLRHGILYTFEVRDDNGCTYTIDPIVVADGRVAVSIAKEINGDGTIKVATEPINADDQTVISWKDVLNENADVNTDALSTGIYQVALTDKNGEELYKEIKSIVSEGARNLQIEDLQDQSKENESNGSVIFKVDENAHFTIDDATIYDVDGNKVPLSDIADSDGTTPVIEITEDNEVIISNLDAGGYAAIIDTKNDSQWSDEKIEIPYLADFKIEKYEPMEIYVATRDVSRPAHNDGKVTAMIYGGIQPYIVWLNDIVQTNLSQTLVTFADVKSGEYTLKVVDAGKNEKIENIQIFEPDEALKLTAEVDSVDCHSNNSGNVNLIATGGWPNYQYDKVEINKKENYQNSPQYSGLPKNDYYFVVIDKYGVTDTLKVPVNEPDELQVSVAQIDSVDCYQNNTGKITFDIQGGNGGYRIKDLSDENNSWIKGNVVDGLYSGEYQYAFTDSKQCPSSPDKISVFVPQPDLLQIASFDQINTTCDEDNGRLELHITGGNMPYNYNWKENGSAMSDNSNIISELKQDGLYEVEVVDYKKCNVKADYRIDHSSRPKVLAVSTTDVLCYGSSDGVAMVDPAQVEYGYPKAEYSLKWPQGQTGAMSVNTLPTGTYYVQITDENNCVDSTKFEIGTPAKLKSHLAASRDAHCYSYHDGMIAIQSVGGIGEHSYQWSTDDKTATIENIGAGTYTVVVTDEHNCSDTAQYSIGEPDELHVDLGNDVTICPNSTYTFDAGPYSTYAWYAVGNDKMITDDRYLTVDEASNYRVVVTNAIGCFARDTVYLGIGNDALVADFLVSSDASLADTLLLVEISNMPLDSIVWVNPKEFKDVTLYGTEDYLLYLKPQKVGTYNLTMKAYSGGCESSETKEIEIFEVLDENNDIDINYNPLIVSVSASPNPNNGVFQLTINLREEHDCSVRINNVSTGQTIETRSLSEAQKYIESFNVGGYGSGLYVLSVTAGEERRVMKVLIKN